tara:strand:- start:5170 stop:5496 length:327 start_codon:yes stop_codon:yes gene_type:complete
MSDKDKIAKLYEEGQFVNMQDGQPSNRAYNPMQGEVSYNKGQIPTAAAGSSSYSVGSPAPGEMEEDDDPQVSKSELLNFVKKLKDKSGGSQVNVDDYLKEIIDFIELS